MTTLSELASMSVSIFQTVPRIQVQPGAWASIGTTCAQSLGLASGASIFLVTDPVLQQTDGFAVGLESLRRSGFTPVIFNQVQPDPPEEVVLAAARSARESQAALVIGFGGGSSLDTAKLAACLAAQPQLELSQLYGVNTCKVHRLPLILVPTTAGTGSEVTSIAIVTTGAQTKAGIVNTALLPDLSVLDATLTLALPPAVTAATGIDAMVHAIEAYTSAHRKNPLSDALAQQALHLLSANLLLAVRHGDQLPAREAMLLGALLAGQAFENAPVAAVHALAYPLGATFHLAHGLSNALMLPHVMRFNAQACTDLYAELSTLLLGIEGPAGLRCETLIDYLQGLIAESGLPQRLSEVGIQAQDLPELARQAMQQTRLLGNNPRPLTEADALALYTQAL